MDGKSLTVVQAGELVLNPDIEEVLIRRAQAAKKAKEEYDSFVAGLQAAMETEGLIKLETPRVLVNYIGESDRETFQSKAFRKDFPQLYDDYCTISKVKAQVRVKVK